MVRRNFEGILDLFPEFTVKMESTDSSEVSSKAVNSRCDVKTFSSSFSIDSILKKEHGLSE